MDEILEALRKQHLAKISENLERARKRGDEPTVWALESSANHVRTPWWEPPRPGRRMPDLWTIYLYWAGREEFADCGGSVSPVPHCFGCGRFFSRIEPESPPEVRWNAARGYLERAHLATRWKGGLDGPQNLVPLRYPCHNVMPRFDFDEGLTAIKWVQDGGRHGMAAEWAKTEASMADAIAKENGGQYPLWVFMPREMDAA